MINAIIVDDEESSQATLKNLIAEFCKNVNLLGIASSVKEGIGLINSEQPDLVFLDVEMPVQNGFSLLKHFEEPDFSVIFTTAFREYAIEAFRFSAVDFLLKPIDLDDMKKAIAKATSKKEAEATKEKLKTLKENLNNVCNKLALPTSDGYYFVELENIIRCSSESNYTFFHLTSGKKILVSKTLKVFNTLLEDHNFFRISRSDLVNLNHIVKFGRQKTPTVTLSDDTTLTLSLRRTEAFIKRIERF